LEAFRALHHELRALVEQQHQTGMVRALPLSPVQLAREAERLEEFRQLVIDLFQLQSTDGDLRLAEALYLGATTAEEAE
jgi:hypothetical protein